MIFNLKFRLNTSVDSVMIQRPSLTNAVLNNHCKYGVGSCSSKLSFNYDYAGKCLLAI